MAIQIIPILKALAPLVANASGIVANMKSSKTTADTEEKVRRLEEGAIRAGELLSAITEQVEAIAQALREQAELNEACLKQAKRATSVAWTAIGIAAVTVVYVLIQSGQS